MHGGQATGHSTTSAAAALASALGDALRQSEGAAHTHVFITGISHVGDDWQASVSTIVEPKADIDPLTPKTAPKKQALEPFPTANGREEDEKEHKRAHDRAVRQHELDEEEAEHERHRHRLQEEVHEQDLLLDAEIVIIYMQSMYEPVFRIVEPEFQFDAVHVLDGSLWEEALRRSPDIELYEAAHATAEPQPGQPARGAAVPGKRNVPRGELVPE